jgi:glycosyltransferase involved in cell wall biosynthesis
MPATKTARSDARKALGLPESKHIVLFVGRLVEKKGARLLLEVSRLIESCHFLIVGDGPVKPTSTENLTWYPSVHRDSMPTVYKAADAFLLPSYSEGFPLSVLEAMASGVPVIVPRDEAFATQLAEQNACVLADRDPRSLCSALTTVIERQDVSMATAERARDLVVRRWSLRAMAALYVDLVRELAAPSRNGKTQVRSR